VGNNTLSSISSISVSNGATLDFDGQTMTGGQTLNVSGTGVGGEGALYSSSGAIYGNVLNINLMGDTKFGAADRWDLGAGSEISGPHSVTVDWTGSGYGEWNTITVGPDVVGVTVTNGNIGMKFMDTAFQNPATMVTVSPNCQLVFYNGGFNGSIHLLGNAIAYLWTAPSAFNGSSVVLEDNAQWESWGSSGTAEPVNSAITLNGVAHFVIGDHNLVYTNLVSGPGGFVSDYWNSQTVFTASNTYAGPTVIGNGPQVALTGVGSISHSALIFFGASSNTVCLDASARTDSTLTLAAGQTLGGIGEVAGNLVAASGATIAPAGTNTTIGITVGSNPTGTILGTGNVTLNGTTVIKLNGAGTNDCVAANGSLNLGGTLNLVNISGAPLAAGNSFQVFIAGGGISGSLASITPATPGAGLAWNTSQLSSGVISVVANAAPVISSIKVVGGNLVFSGTGGGANGSYQVITATSLLTPLANWTVLGTGAFDGSGNFSVTNAIQAGTPQQFYRIK
jgi:hypothetical protein